MIKILRCSLANDRKEWSGRYQSTAGSGILKTKYLKIKRTFLQCTANKPQSS